MVEYDCIVIGSGMGGSAAAYALTQLNKNVLLIEAGGRVTRSQDDWDAKRILVDGHYKSDRATWIKQYDQTTHQPQRQEEVLGGKTPFYGGACFRLRPNDFATWPLSYDQMQPWYLKAEKMLEVHGQAGQDPTEAPRQSPYPYAPAPLSPPAQRIERAAKALHLSPSRIPLSINSRNQARPLCIECNTCDGFPCKLKAKNEAETSFLAQCPSNRLTIAMNTLVTHLEMMGDKVQTVHAMNKQTKAKQSYRAPVVLVAAGALESAALLLRSNVPNGSDMLGKNLMRHCNGVVGGLFAFSTNPSNVFHKQIVISDLYEKERDQTGYAIGVIQDIYMPPKAALAHFAPKGLRWATMATRSLIQNLLCVAEDEPQSINRVYLSQDQDAYGLAKTMVDHQYTQQDLARKNQLTGLAKKVLRKAGALLTVDHKIDSFSHAVGTARFGHDPNACVLDAQCKLHGLSNLYVVDGSFMPTSGGVNPSLTIAANALRVAHHIGSEVLS